MTAQDEAVARVDALVCGWCDNVRDVCPCSPRPLPEPARSAVVLTLQHAIRAETACEPLDDGPGPVTPEPTPKPVSGGPGPLTPLSPGYYRKTGGAA